MIAVLIAFWKRPEVTAVVMRHYMRMAAARGDLRLVAVGSEGAASRTLAEDSGWTYVEAPNSPLSDKLSAGLSKCREFSPAGVLAMGSDDIVTEPWVERCSKADVMHGLRDMYLLRRLTWAGLHWPGYTGVRQGESVGAHRHFPASMLDDMGWELWPKGLEKNLDGNLTRVLASGRVRPKVLSMQDAGCCAVGICSEGNITPWSYRLRGAITTRPKDFLSQLPAETRGEILKLRG